MLHIHIYLGERMELGRDGNDDTCTSILLWTTTMAKLTVRFVPVARIRLASDGWSLLDDNETQSSQMGMWNGNQDTNESYLHLSIRAFSMDVVRHRV